MSLSATPIGLLIVRRCTRCTDSKKCNQHKRCLLGCTCKKHMGKRSKCAFGCVCSRHKFRVAHNKGKECPKSCPCDKHTRSGRFGKHRNPDEAIERMRQTKRGKKWSDEMRASRLIADKRPEVFLKRSRSQKGKVRSPESNLKRSVAQLGKKILPETIEKRRGTMLARYGRADGPKFDTKPELEIRHWLDSRNIQYLSQQPVFGILSDFYVPSTKTVIFVDGCYWHGHEKNCNWQWKKFNGLSEAQLQSKLRDSSANTKLSTNGYTVRRVWACDIKNLLSGNILWD